MEAPAPATPSAERAMPITAERWRAKAEELRVIAESCRSASARETLQRLVRSYDLLADRAEANDRTKRESSG